MSKFKIRLILMMFLIILVACTPGNSVPSEQAGNSPVDDMSPVSEAELEGTEWFLVSLGSEENPQMALKDIEVTVRFNNYIDMGGSTGCNHYGRHFEIEGLNLITDDLQRTRFNCLDPAIKEQEETVMAALESLAMIGRIEDTLVITYDGGILQFMQEPPPPVTDLTGTKWQLTEMVIDEQVILVLEGTLITAEFQEGLMSGIGGCNSYGGEYELDGTTFSIGEINETAQLCLDDTLMDQERDFINILKSATEYSLEGEMLIIRNLRNSLHFQSASSSTGSPLRGVSWRLSAFVENGQQQLPVEDTDITIQFDGSQFSGWTGCNQYSGNYNVADATIHMDSAFVTQMECTNQGAGQQEREFLDIINQNPSLQFTFDQYELRLEYDGGALLFSSDGDRSSEPEEVTVPDGLAVYENPYLNVWLTYPAHWERDPGFNRPQAGARFFGEDGFFMVSVMSFQDGTLDMAVEAETSKSSISYGSAPTIEAVNISCQPGRVIWPSEDQLDNMNNTAVLLLLYPEMPDGETNLVDFLVLQADKEHMDRLIEDLRFTSPVAGEPYTACETK